MPSSRIYLLIGDPFLCEDKFKFLQNQIEKESSGEVLSSIFYLSETSLDEILVQARTLPFLASHQILLIREAEELKEKHLEGFNAYLENPYEKTTLIFEADSGEKELPLKTAIQSKKTGEVVFFEEAQKKKSGEQFVKTKLREHGKTILPQALARLMEKMGDHPMLLHSVLEHVIAYADQQTVIDEDMVETFEERFEELDSFQLADALGNRKTAKALLLLRKLLEHADSDASAMIGMFHWQFKRFWKVAALMDSGQGQESALRECRISPKQAPFFLRQLKLFSRSKLENILESLFRLDWKMKTGQVEGVSALESWVIETTQS